MVIVFARVITIHGISAHPRSMRHARRAPIARCKDARSVQRRYALARAPPPARLLGLHHSRSHRWLCLLSSSSLERLRVDFAPVRGPIGGKLADWTLASAQGARARGAATLHPMQPRHWPSEAASQQPWPKRARKQRRVRTSRFAGRRVADGGRARRSRSRGTVVDLPCSTRAESQEPRRACAHEASEVRAEMAWAHLFSR